MKRQDTARPERVKETPQSRRFIEAAREVGADEDEDAFKRKLEKIAKAKPKDDKPKETR